MSTEPTGDAPRPAADRAVDVVLAEFNALRTEMVGYLSAQAAVVGLGLTALGVITSLAVGKDGDDGLLMAIPPLVALIVLVHTASTYRVAKIGDYIRESLWPDLEDRVGAIPSWERYLAGQRSRYRAVVKAIAVDFPAMGLFIAASIIVLATTQSKFDALWWLGAIVTAIAIAFPVGVGSRIRVKSSA